MAEEQGASVADPEARKARAKRTKNLSAKPDVEKSTKKNALSAVKFVQIISYIYF